MISIGEHLQQFKFCKQTHFYVPKESQLKELDFVLKISDETISLERTFCNANTHLKFYFKTVK